MLILQGVAYTHPDRDILFDNIDVVINKHDKTALVGNNGAGKSTLLKIMAGILQPARGVIKAGAVPWYVPQLFWQYNHYTVARALGVEDKLAALNAILNGDVTETNLTILDDDWAIEERCHEALAYWQLGDVNLAAKMENLSGGEKTKVFLSGIMIHRPEIILMDEPSNHLDTTGRQLLYQYISSSSATLVVVSHDRTLLNLLNTVYELDKRGATVYGGNYDFYAGQKEIERNALGEDLKSKEKAFRKAKGTERETLERQQKLDARGKKKQEKAGLPTISMNTLRNNAEKSTSRIKDIHAGKIEAISGEIARMRKELPDKDKMKIGFDDTSLHKGKILVSAKEVNAAYGTQPLWQQPLSFIITGGERIAIKGKNGSGKTTLVKLLLGQMQPQTGMINRASFKAIYIDQDYSLIDNTISVYAQAQKYNSGKLEEAEVKSRLSHFLFTSAYWDKPCSVLSGGEKMRLVLCCLTLGNRAPDMIVLDEPTNNLDMQNIDILIGAINEYNGTVIVISHDEHFLSQVNIEHSISLG